MFTEAVKMNFSTTIILVLYFLNDALARVSFLVNNQTA